MKKFRFFCERPSILDILRKWLIIRTTGIKIDKRVKIHRFPVSARKQQKRTPNQQEFHFTTDCTFDILYPLFEFNLADSCALNTRTQSIFLAPFLFFMHFLLILEHTQQAQLDLLYPLSLI